MAVVGKIVTEPTELHLSWQSVKAAMEYRIFMSRMSVLCSDEIQERQNSKAVMPDKYFSDLAAALNAGQESESRKAIHDIVDGMVRGPYSAAHCNTKILEAVSVISRFLHAHSIRTEDIEGQDFEAVFYSMEDIYEIEKWMTQVVHDAFALLENRQENSAQQLVDKAKAYIREHLSEELSLRSVAEQVYISPSYLSKVFKEEAGVNFSDYVTDARMKKAADLLLNTNLKVEAIAQTVGYNTPHYFIRKFKESYGITPKNYRLERG